MLSRTGTLCLFGMDQQQILDKVSLKLQMEAVGYPLARNACSNLFGRFSSKKTLHVLLLIGMYLFTDSLRSITKRCSHIFFGEILFVFDLFSAPASCKVTDTEQNRYPCIFYDF